MRPYDEGVCAEIRRELYRAYSAELQGRFGLKDLEVGPITGKVFAGISTAWAPSGQRLYPHWDWRGLHQGAVNRPCRFEVAISQGELPLAVAIGKPSKGFDFLGIPRLEGCPIANPLKGFAAEAIFEIAAAYGIALELPELRLLDPVADLLDFYRGLGFVVDQDKQGKLYCSKPLGG
jgi:hypothetical protein